jgi:hypothetical protein
MTTSALGPEGIEAIVVVTVGGQPSLFESVLPPELLRLPEELGRAESFVPVFTRGWVGPRRRWRPTCG